MNKAVFIDRDGVINHDPGDYTYKLSEFKILDGVTEALKKFINKGYLLIIITNQGGISKKIYGHEEVKLIHDYLIEKLTAEHILLTEIYYCPHHPDSEKCICRKPGSLLLEKAIARFAIDASQSYFIGDRDRDKEAGIMAGVQPIVIPTNSSMSAIVNLVK